MPFGYARDAVAEEIEQVLGFSHAEWIADPTFWIDRLHPEDRDRVLAEVTRCIEMGEPIKMEYRMLAKDGSVVGTLEPLAPADSSAR